MSEPLDPTHQEGVGLLALIRVGAIQVPFFTKDGLAESDKGDCVGVTNFYPYPHVIIDGSLGPQARAMTMIHELFHVLSELGGFSLTERQVLGLEHGFGQLVQDNSDTMSSIFQGLQRRDVPPAVLKCLKDDESTEALPASVDRGVNLN